MFFFLLMALQPSASTSLKRHTMKPENSWKSLIFISPLVILFSWTETGIDPTNYFQQVKSLSTPFITFIANLQRSSSQEENTK